MQKTKFVPGYGIAEWDMGGTGVYWVAGRAPESGLCPICGAPLTEAEAMDSADSYMIVSIGCDLCETAWELSTYPCM